MAERHRGRVTERLLLCGDDQLVVVGLLVGLRKDSDLAVAGTAPLRELAAAIRRVRPTVLVLDVPAVDDTVVQALAGVAGQCATVVLGHEPDPSAGTRVRRAGGHRYLRHGTLSIDDVRQAVRGAVRSGPAAWIVPTPVPGPVPVPVPAPRDGLEPAPAPVREVPAGLSPRERDVITAMARGLSNRDIAAELTVTEKTVKNYINRLFPKLGVRTRAEAIVMWLAAARSVA